MTRPLWARVDDLYHAALEKPPVERQAFVDQACTGDEELRNEVQSLLNYEREADGLMERPAASAETQRLAVTRGTRLGPYEVIDLLGAGGMGEVYRATDTRLGREVAVKVLPAEFASDPERLRRFEREARAVASLNHPHILTVHDVGTHEGTPYVVTELLEGETLRDLMARHPPKLKEALSFAVQAAQGLAAAHAKGIVHRDLKPENLFVAKGGMLKILDFGLAKQLSPAQSGEPRPTVSDATRDGVVMGTVAYMSPEQVQGLPVDARSDVFSFGVVLYELLTHKHPFRRDTPAATLGAILETEARPPGEITPALRQDLEKIVHRCLRKDSDRRFQLMADVELELEEIAADVETRSTQAQAPALRRAWWLAGAAAALALVATSIWLWRRSSEPAFSPPTLVQLTSYPGDEVFPAVSPDGRLVAFAWNGEQRDNFDIYVQMIGGGPPLRLTSDPASDSLAAWSADGRYIAFRRRSDAGLSVYVTPALGGIERKVADLDPGETTCRAGLSWTPDGQGLVASEAGPDSRSHVVLLPVGRGERRQLLLDRVLSYCSPALSADGRFLAYAVCTGTYACVMQVVPLAPDFTPQGPPRRLTEKPAMVYGITWAWNERSLIYAAGDSVTPYLWRVGVAGREPPQRLDLAGVNAFGPSASRAMNRLVFSRGNRDFDIWKIEDGGPPQAFIASTRLDAVPQFSPDGTRLAFCSNRTASLPIGRDVAEVFVASVDGKGPMQLTDGPGREQCGPSWSPDSKQIAFDSQAEDGNWDIYSIDAAGGAPRLLNRSRADENLPRWSRDGRWIYFASNRTGRYEIWRVPARGGEATQVTQAGGRWCSESPDGRSLYYVKEEHGLQPLFVRPVAGGAEQQVLEAVVLLTFVVVEDGVYYFGPRADRSPGAILRFFSFETGTSHDLARIDTLLEYGLTVSADRRTILFTALKPGHNYDLMLIENLP